MSSIFEPAQTDDGRSYDLSASSLVQSRDYLQGNPLTFIRLLCVGCLSCLVVDGGLEQLQMFATGGHIVITGSVVKLGLMMLLGLAMLIQGKLRKPKAFLPLLLFAAYLTVDAIYLVFSRDLAVVDLLQSFNSYYGLLFVGAAAYVSAIGVSEKTLTRLLVVLFLACSLLAIAQSITNDPIVPVTNADGSFRVLGWSNSAHSRAFSVFRAPALLGCFASFMAALGVALASKPEGRIKGWALLLLGLTISYLTLVRTTFLQCAFAIVSAYVLCAFHSRSRRLLTQFMPYLWLVLGAATMAFAFWRAAAGGADSSLTDTSSFTARLFEWRFYLGQFSGASIGNKLFGMGLYQGSKTDSVSSIPIDNAFIAVLVHIGIVGLILMLPLLWQMLRALNELAEETRSPLAIAAAATWSVIWLSGLFEVFTYYFAAIYLTVMIALPTSVEISPRHEDSGPFYDPTAVPGDLSE